MSLLLLGVFLASAVPLLEAQVPAINSAGNATAQVTVPFTYRITATNSPTSYSIISSGPSSLVQSLYRGAFGNQTTASGKIWMSGSGQEFPNAAAFAAITSNGSAVAWGNPAAGGNATAASSSLSSNVTAIYSNSQAFAALKSNGSVVTWGNEFYGGKTSGALGGNLTSGVVSISSTSSAFAALKSNGSVVTWGNPDLGGNSISRVGGNLTSNVTAIYSNAGAFAALKSNGSVVTWGDPWAGGNSTLFELDQAFNTVETSMASQLTSGVVSISSTQNAFAARKSDGSVVTWGDMAGSGAYTPPSAGSLSSNVTAVFSNENAFAALKSNGSVVTWGSSMSGGDSSSVSANLTSAVTAIYSNPIAFAALKSNGSVVTWGYPISGGVSSFPAGGNLTEGVKSISSTQFAFAALKNNGSVVTWGEDMSGGDSSSVSANLTSNVTAVYATQSAFAALKSDGSVVTWGFSDLGGDSTSVAQLLTSNVTAIAANSGAFAALKRNGSIVTWGSSAPGDIPAPANIGAPAADITSLTGLSFNSANGSLSGSPTKSGNFSLRLGATNASGTGNAPFSLLILPASGMSLSGNLSFGNVFVGQNATRNFSITNPASGPLTVNSIASSNSSFSLSGNATNLTVPSGLSQNVSVRFQPAAPGNFTANITIASNAGNNTLTATGTGVPAASPITITGNLSFGSVTVNQTANSTLSIKNNASSTVTMSVAVPSWLTANATGNFTLAGNATRNVKVTFRPTSEGNFTGNITATSAVGNAIISASGAGVHTRIIGLSGNLSFGNLGVNATATRNLTITNTGTGNLTISGISSSNASFVLTGNTTNLVVGPGGNRTIGVVFQPASAGNLTGNITVNSDATSGNSTIAASGTGVLVPVITGNLSASGVVGGNFSYQIVASNNATSFSNSTALPAGLKLNATTGLISGKPTAPFTGNITLRATNAGGTGTTNLTVAISPSRIIGLSGNLSFGNSGVNATATRNLRITNNGTGNLTISGISSSNASFVLTGNTTNLVVGPGGNRTIGVVFQPNYAGNFTGIITVNSDATSGNSTIAASGTGVFVPVITSNLSASGVVNGNFSYQIVASNNATSFGNSTALPAGLSLNATTGLISGKPTAPFTGNVTLRATNAGGTGTTNLTVAISPSRIIGLSGNLSFGNSGVNATATRNLTITNTGTGNLTITGISSSNASFVLTGNTTNLVVGRGGNRTVSVVFQPNSTGNFTGIITVNSDATSGNSTIAASGTGVFVPVITSNLSASGVVGGNFSYQITASNNPISFGNDPALPAGLSLNATTTRNLTITNTGTGNLTITGISSSNASFVLTGNTTNLVVGRGGNRTVSVVFQPNSTGNFTGNITVNSDATSGNSTIAASGTGVLVPVITGNLSASGVVNGNFSYQITADNDPTSFGNATALPAGLSLNATTGLISGMPSAGGNFVVTISATNSGGTGTANLTVAISDNRTITIAGSRTTVAGKSGIRVEGDTVGFKNGDRVVPYVRFPGQEYVQGSPRPDITDGEFFWERKTGKKTYIYFTSEDGSVQSNRVIIPAH